MYFEDEPEERNNREHEPAQYRQLAKKTIFKMASLNKLMPDYKSRVVSRRWLIGTEDLHYFSLNKVEVLQFEALLNFEDKVRNHDQSMAIVVEKVNEFLINQGRLPLGYENNCYPDEEYMYRLARFVDPSNVLRIFKKAIPNAPRPGGAIGRV